MKQCVSHALEEASYFIGGIIPSRFATIPTVDKSLSLKLKDKKKLLGQYSSKVGDIALACRFSLLCNICVQACRPLSLLLS